MLLTMGGGKIKNLLFNESFSFTFWFRIGSWLEYSNHGFYVLYSLCSIEEKCVEQEDKYLWEHELGEVLD